MVEEKTIGRKDGNIQYTQEGTQSQRQKWFG